MFLFLHLLKADLKGTAKFRWKLTFRQKYIGFLEESEASESSLLRDSTISTKHLNRFVKKFVSQVFMHQISVEFVNGQNCIYRFKS